MTLGVTQGSGVVLCVVFCFWVSFLYCMSFDPDIHTVDNNVQLRSSF